MKNKNNTKDIENIFIEKYIELRNNYDKVVDGELELPNLIFSIKDFLSFLKYKKEFKVLKKNKEFLHYKRKVYKYLEQISNNNTDEPDDINLLFIPVFNIINLVDHIYLNNTRKYHPLEKIKEKRKKENTIDVLKKEINNKEGKNFNP